MTEANAASREARRLANVLRVAQQYSDEYGEVMIRAAGTLDRYALADEAASQPRVMQVALALMRADQGPVGSVRSHYRKLARAAIAALRDTAPAENISGTDEQQ